MKTLRDWLPHEFFSEFMDTPAARHLDVEVVEEVYGSFIGPNKLWPGKHRNVMHWCKLANGRAVGWNENPSVGWSFPVMRA